MAASSGDGSSTAIAIIAAIAGAVGGALVTGLVARLIYKSHKTEQQVRNEEMVDVAEYMKQVKNDPNDL
ncbi:MAG: hypothetical protein AB8V23_05470 [Candidatus Midichloria sp.]